MARNWEQRLTQGRFGDGPQFHIEQNATEERARLAIKYFTDPSKDPLIQKLGKKEIVFTIQGYFIDKDDTTNDPHAHIQTMRAQLDQTLPLRLSYTGIQQATLRGFVYTDRRTEGGVARFTAEFVAGTVSAVVVDPNFANQVRRQAIDLFGKAEDRVIAELRPPIEFELPIPTADGPQLPDDIEQEANSIRRYSNFVRNLSTAIRDFNIISLTPSEFTGTIQDISQAAGGSLRVLNAVNNRILTGQFLASDVGRLLRGLGSGDIRATLGALSDLGNLFAGYNEALSPAEQQRREGNSFLLNYYIAQTSLTTMASLFADHPNFFRTQDELDGFYGSYVNLNNRVRAQSDSSTWDILTKLGANVKDLLTRENPTLPQLNNVEPRSNLLIHESRYEGAKFVPTGDTWEAIFERNTQVLHPLIPGNTNIAVLGRGEA